MNVEILSVGTELLLGDILNTNAQYLAKELAGMGLSVFYQTVVGDNPERLFNAYKIAFGRADVVITTGGLGPTDDDLTKEIAAKYFEKELVLDDYSLQKLENMFKSMNRPITKNNYKQVYFPVGSIILKNDNGTAPGCFISENGKMLFMIPGPPKEAIPMFQNEIVPILIKKSDGILFSKTLRISGIGESSLEDMIKDILDEQTNPSLALYAKTFEVHLRITAKADTKEDANILMLPTIEKLYDRLGENIYGEDLNSLELVVVNKIIEKGFTVSCAESCTGGKLSSKFVSCAGVSKIFLEAAITYSNEAKINRLDVKKETLDKYGAVSKETAIEMAIGIAKSSSSNIGISTTGIAGPGAGTVEKPVGLVYIGLYINGETFVQECRFLGDREKIRSRATTSALDFIRRQLK